MTSSVLAGYSREDLLHIALASPQAVAKHDKQAWLSLFAKQSVIEDPVGTAPHKSVLVSSQDSGFDNTQLDKFYDTFIAPNDIVFLNSYDIVTNDSVLRDVTLQITSSSGLVTNVHMYVVYKMTDEAGILKVSRLAAHWDLMGMVKKVVLSGWPGLKMMTSLSARMLKIQGLKGVWGYMGGFGGIGKRGKKSVQSFAKAANDRDTNSLREMFISDDGSIEFPVGSQPFSLENFVSSVNGNISASAMISAGWTTGFRFQRSSGQAVDDGIGLFEFDAKTKKIKRARFFIESLSS